MATASRRAAARPSRGGLPNALFVVAAVEATPAELDGVADLVTVHFPWGSLLRGLLGADPAIMSSLTRVLRPSATCSCWCHPRSVTAASGWHPSRPRPCTPWPRRTPPGGWPSRSWGRRLSPTWPLPTRAGANAWVPAPAARPGYCGLGSHRPAGGMHRPGAPRDPVRSRHTAATRPAPSVAARVGPPPWPGPRRARPHPQRLYTRHLAFCDWCQRYLQQMRETIRLTGTLREDDLTPEAQDGLLGVFRDWRRR